MANPPQPPKLSEVGKTSGIERATAWGCILGNLVLPGVGTFLARRRIAGILQLVVSQTGFVMMMLWAFAYVRDWLRAGSLPEDFGTHFGLVLLGLAMFFFAWFWSLVSSLQILRDARKTKS